jgi:hypothetical protein
MPSTLRSGLPRRAASIICWPVSESGPNIRDQEIDAHISTAALSVLSSHRLLQLPRTEPFEHFGDQHAHGRFIIHDQDRLPGIDARCRVKVWRRENAHQLVFGGSAPPAESQGGPVHPAGSPRPRSAFARTGRAKAHVRALPARPPSCHVL